MRRQICGIKCQNEVKPVPTELEYTVDVHVTSTAQRETGISTSPIHLRCVSLGPTQIIRGPTNSLLHFRRETEEKTEETLVHMENPFHIYSGEK